MLFLWLKEAAVAVAAASESVCRRCVSLCVSQLYFCLHEETFQLNGLLYVSMFQNCNFRYHFATWALIKLSLLKVTAGEPCRQFFREPIKPKIQKVLLLLLLTVTLFRRPPPCWPVCSVLLLAGNLQARLGAHTTSSDWSPGDHGCLW